MKIFSKMNVVLAAVFTTVALTAVPAAADSSSVGIGTGVSASDASSSLDTTSNSVGLAGLAGGVCSEGGTVGFAGFGIGASELNEACILLQTIPRLVQAGVLTKAQGAAFTLAALESLGYGLVPKQAEVAASTSAPVATPAAPAEPVRMSWRDHVRALPMHVGAWEDLTRTQHSQIIGCEAAWDQGSGRSVAGNCRADYES